MTITKPKRIRFYTKVPLNLILNLKGYTFFDDGLTKKVSEK